MDDPPDSLPKPLARAHAHNDYEHPRPLLDALSHGFTSVEADIWLVEGRLLVAHHRKDVRPERDLESLYLEPLAARLRQVSRVGSAAAGDGPARVFPGGPEFTLLIDLKSAAEPTYLALHDVLARYAEILTEVRRGKVTVRALRVIISGNRPRELIAKQELRYAAIDGRLGDLESDAPAHLLPLISDRWTSHFRWRGEGPMPAAEAAKLRAIVARAHRDGRRVRFWATPERRAVWTELRDAGVDLINTDDLAGLEKFSRAPRRLRI